MSDDIRPCWWDGIGRWHVADSRTGNRIGLETYPTKKYAEKMIAGWTARDANGGRRDIHHLIPFMVAVEETEK